MLRTRYAEPTPGLLGETLAALTDAAEEGARRTLLSGRRLAYAGAIGGTAVAAAATAAAPDRAVPQALVACGWRG